MEMEILFIFFINFYMSTLEKAEPSELTESIRHIVMLSKSRIPIYNSEVPNTTAEKQEEEEERRQLESVMRFTQTH